MNVVILINSMRYGGANKVLVDLANYLAEKQYNVTIITYLDDKKFYKINKNILTKNIYTKFDNLKGIRRIAQVLKLRCILKSEEADVVIAFNNTAKLIGLVATLFSKYKIIISERLDPYNYKPGKKRNMHFRYLLSDGCVFQTKGAASYFPKRVRDRSVIIPNFIEIDKAYKSPVKKRKNEISFVARLDIRQKRQDLILIAFQKIVTKYPEIKLVFYGDGPDRSKVEELVIDFGLQKNVKFAGVVKNVKDSIRESKIFVMASDYEGIPNALMEAMSIGLPVVSTDCSPGGAKLLIEDKVNGLLVPTNEPDRLAEAIIFLLKNPNRAEKIGNNARVVSSLYHPSRILPMWENYIRSIINK